VLRKPFEVSELKEAINSLPSARWRQDLSGSSARTVGDTPGLDPVKPLDEQIWVSAAATPRPTRLPAASPLPTFLQGRKDALEQPASGLGRSISCSKRTFVWPVDDERPSGKQRGPTACIVERGSESSPEVRRWRVWRSF
jgi:hypothetical protein